MLFLSIQFFLCTGMLINDDFFMKLFFEGYDLILIDWINFISGGMPVSLSSKNYYNLVELKLDN